MLLRKVSLRRSVSQHSPLTRPTALAEPFGHYGVRRVVRGMIHQGNGFTPHEE